MQREGTCLKTKVQKRVTWLHLSDVHFCPEKSGWDAASVLRTLRRDLVFMQQSEQLCPDLIFFTGDLAFGQLPESPMTGQYEQAMLFLDGIRQSFEPAVGPEMVFLVPGNHDVNRTLVGRPETVWLDQIEQGEGAQIVSLLMRDGNCEWRRIMERLQDYRQCLERHGYAHLLTDPDRLIYTAVRTVAGCNIGIAGFNTAWSCGRKLEAAKLWLGRWQLEKLRSALEDCSFRIALTHHPLNWLRPEENGVLRREIERSFEFHLHGHEHQNWVDAFDRHVRIAAGACYEDSTKENGYSFVRLQPGRGSGEVFFRTYDALGGGWVARNVFGRAPDGRWPLTLRWLNQQLQKDVSVKALEREENLTKPPSFSKVRINRATQRIPVADADDALPGQKRPKSLNSQWEKSEPKKVRGMRKTHAKAKHKPH
ncbi:MAG TPA: metallophosphoesterase [Candidatus Acidoferrales bacterium]|nr:metallophosphoesterase [Candidatus Acidoferrales bacterium]